MCVISELNIMSLQPQSPELGIIHFCTLSIRFLPDNHENFRVNVGCIL